MWGVGKRVQIDPSPQKKLPLKKPSFIRVKQVFVTFPDWLILQVSTRILRFFYKFLICEKVDDNYISDCPRMVINIESWLTMYREKN